MKQTLHLFIVNSDGHFALVSKCGSRWLLPLIVCAERIRPDRIIVNWAAENRISADILGQWLGRVARGGQGIDWLVVMRARDVPSVLEPPLAWTALEECARTIGVLDYQAWAIAATLQSGSQPSVRGPFGNLTWLNDVKAWITASVRATASSTISYRVTAHEVVLGADTASGRVYFKGLTNDRVTESRLTMALAALVPGSFARTLAIEERRDRSVWWLTAECPGRAADAGDPVARALARLQRRVMSSGPVRRELRDVNVDAAVQWACALVEEEGCADAIRRHAHAVAIADVPESWIPMDLDPTNVLVAESGEVRFIDLDESYFGPAPLAMATFAQRCRDTSIYRVYEQSWSPPLTDMDWPSFEVVAAVFEAWRGWQRVEQNTRRGEVHGALDLAASRIRERLTGVVQRRTIVVPSATGRSRSLGAFGPMIHG